MPFCVKFDCVVKQQFFKGKREKFMEKKYAIAGPLAMDWWFLTVDVLKDKKFDENLYFRLFKESFDFVRKYAYEDTISREGMELFKNISIFVGTRFNSINNEHYVACELADAMITHCFCDEKKDILTSKGKWVLFRDEIEVDFDDVEMEYFRWTVEIEKLFDIGW